MSALFQLTRGEALAFVVLLKRIRTGHLRASGLADTRAEAELMRRACLKVAAAFTECGSAVS